MQAEILGIGSELTSGHTINSNAAYLARQLEQLGVRCLRHMALADEPSEIINGLREALGRAEVVITTGGLGPTVDDITVEMIAKATGRPLVRRPDVARRIEGFYRRYRRRLNRLALRQAELPSGAIALPNDAGTAPGIWLPLGDALLIALPGVPREMRAIMERSVVPRLRRRLRTTPIVSRTLRTVGVLELQIQQLLETLHLPANVQFGLYPHLKSVDVRFTVTDPSMAKVRQLLDRLEQDLRRALGEAVYGTDAQTLEEVIGQTLRRRRLTLAVAESCTGGQIADRLTNVPGSSDYFLGGVIAYHNRIKEAWLGVPSSTLARHGAVSAQTAEAMAQGVRRRMEADVALSVTGIAGPSGGSAAKPVGLVYFAIAEGGRVESLRSQFHGDREAVKQQAAQIGLDWLRRFLGAQRKVSGER